MAASSTEEKKQKKVHYSSKIDSFSGASKARPVVLKHSRLWLMKTNSYTPEINQLFVPPSQTYTSPIEQYTTFDGIVSY